MYMANLWQAQHLNVANNVIANIVNLSKKTKEGCSAAPPERFRIILV